MDRLLMTQDEIKAGTERHAARIEAIRAEMNGLIEIQRGWLRYYQGFCKHPNIYATSCMGDSGTHCPDCGYST